MHVDIDTGLSAWLLGLASQRSDPLREVDSFLASFGFGFFSLLFATSKSQDLVERVRNPHVRENWR